MPRTPLGRKWAGKLADMARSKAERTREEKAMRSPSTKAGKDYGYGLSLELDHDALAKVGVKGAPKAGQQFTVTARAHVRHANTSHDEKGGRHNASLQITHLSLGPQTKTGPVIAKRKGK